MKTINIVGRWVVTIIFLLGSISSAADFDVYQRNYMDRVYPDTVVAAEDLIVSLPDNVTPLLLQASPGEYEPLSIVLKPGTDILDFDIKVSDLVKGTAVIPSAAVDIGIVRNHKTNASYSNVGARIIAMGGSWGIYFVGQNMYFYTVTASGYKSIKYVPTSHRWIHITATYDGAEMRLYVNGGTTNCSGMAFCSEPQTGAVKTNNNALNIGSRVNENRWFYDGMIDELALSALVKTEQDIASDYANCQTGNCSVNGDLAVWHFDEGSGDILSDSIGSLNGVISGDTGADRWVGGKSGTAFRFNGDDNAVSLAATANNLGVTDKLTVEFWIKPTLGYETPRVLTSLPIYKNEYGSELAVNTNNWVWFTVNVPEDADPGQYQGNITITLKDGSVETVKTYPLQLTVLPVSLQTAIEPTPSVYYTVLPKLLGTLSGVDLLHDDGTLLTAAEVGDDNGNGIIDDNEKVWWFIDQQLQDIKAHGFHVSPNLVFRAGKNPRPFLLDPVYDGTNWNIDYTNLERFMGLMIKYGHHKGNITFWDLFAQIAQGAITTANGKEWNVSPFLGFSDDYKTAFRRAVQHFKTEWEAHQGIPDAEDWPPLIGEVWDEPVSTYIEQAKELLQIVREEGLQGITHVNDSLDESVEPAVRRASALYPNLNIPEVGSNSVNTPFLTELNDNGMNVWVYNMNSMWFVKDIQEVFISATGGYEKRKGLNNGEERFVYGLLLEKLYQQQAVKAAVQFIYGYFTTPQWGNSGEPHYPKFGIMEYWNSREVPGTASLSLLSPYGAIPTVNWEWSREGVDDQRYIFTLKQSIAAALATGDPEQVSRAVAAKSVLDNILGLIGNKLPDPLDYEQIRNSMANDDLGDDSLLLVGDYDVHRAAIADEIMKLNDDDSDGLSNYKEFIIIGTNTRVSDTDGDGVNDGAEVNNGTNPLQVDTDRDTLSDSADSAPLDLFSPNNQGLNLANDTQYQQPTINYSDTDTLYILAWSASVGPTSATHSYTITGGGSTLASGDLTQDNGDGSYEVQIPITSLNNYSGDALVSIKLQHRKNKYIVEKTITIAGDIPPTVSITTPSDGASFASGELISFSGSASDTEDGDLTTSLSWSSDIDGAIGSGGSFSATLSDGSHTITVSITDSGGKTSNGQINIDVGTPPIALTAIGNKVKGKHIVDLTWSGATSTNIDIYRDGTIIATVADTGAYTDNIGAKGGATYVYKVCEASSTIVCSADVTVVF